ncbi:hypothetical protein ASF12_07505 [Paenibacillus sp. Leaf72]|nr:hypothetical protein ASF12_07505 [Paenibacillus sp. Leaf72]
MDAQPVPLSMTSFFLYLRLQLVNLGFPLLDPSLGFGFLVRQLAEFDQLILIRLGAVVDGNDRSDFLQLVDAFRTAEHDDQVGMQSKHVLGHRRVAQALRASKLIFQIRAG